MTSSIVSIFQCFRMTDGVAKEYYESSKLARYPFEPYWPDKKLRICVTGAGGFIASHLAKRLKSEGHHIIGCDWKRNEHMPVRQPCSSHVLFKIARKVEQHVSEASTLRTRSSHRLQRFARACSMLCKGADSACS